MERRGFEYIGHSQSLVDGEQYLFYVIGSSKDPRIVGSMPIWVIGVYHADGRVFLGNQSNAYSWADVQVWSLPT